MRTVWRIAVGAVALALSTAPGQAQESPYHTSAPLPFVSPKKVGVKPAAVQEPAPAATKPATEGEGVANPPSASVLPPPSAPVTAADPMGGAGCTGCGSCGACGSSALEGRSSKVRRVLAWMFYCPQDKGWGKCKGCWPNPCCCHPPIYAWFPCTP